LFYLLALVIAFAFSLSQALPPVSRERPD